MGGDRAIFLVAHVHRQGIDPGQSARSRPFAAGRAGAHVVVEARGDNVTKAGVRYDNDYCLVFRLENGKIKEVREYCDSVLTEKALGPFSEPLRRAAG